MSSSFSSGTVWSPWIISSVVPGKKISLFSALAKTGRTISKRFDVASVFWSIFQWQLGSLEMWKIHFGSCSFWNRSKFERFKPVCNIALNLTVATKKLKFYMRIEFQMGYIIVQIQNGICQYQEKYATLNNNMWQFSIPSPSTISGKKFKALKHIQIHANCIMLRSGFLPENALGGFF